MVFFSHTDFLFVAAEGITGGIRPLRELIDLKNGSIIVYGDDIHVCEKQQAETIQDYTTAASILSIIPTAELKGRVSIYFLIFL